MKTKVVVTAVITSLFLSVLPLYEASARLVGRPAAKSSYKNDYNSNSIGLTSSTNSFFQIDKPATALRGRSVLDSIYKYNGGNLKDEELSLLYKLNDKEIEFFIDKILERNVFAPTMYDREVIRSYWAYEIRQIIKIINREKMPWAYDGIKLDPNTGFFLPDNKPIWKKRDLQQDRKGLAERKRIKSKSREVAAKIRNNVNMKSNEKDIGFNSTTVFM